MSDRDIAKLTVPEITELIEALLDELELRYQQAERNFVFDRMYHAC